MSGFLCPEWPDLKRTNFPSMEIGPKIEKNTFFSIGDHLLKVVRPLNKVHPRLICRSLGWTLNPITSAAGTSWLITVRPPRKRRKKSSRLQRR
ncbi:hypothetical protein U1Q18_022789 [Sarracenia purpurea var. burkii]